MTCRHDAPAVASVRSTLSKANHFVWDRLRKTPVVIPTTLAGGLDPVAVPNCLRIMEILFGAHHIRE